MYSSWDGFWEAHKKIRRSQGIPKLPAFKSCTMNRPSIDGMSNLPNCKAQLLVFTGTGRLCVDLAFFVLEGQPKQTKRSAKKILLDLYILFLAFYFEWKSRKKSAWPVQKRTAMHSNVGNALSLIQKVSWFKENLMCVYIYICICLWMCVCICMYVNIYIYMYVYVYIYMYIYVYICIYMYIYIYTYVYIYIRIYMCIYTYIYVCLWICVCICMYVYVYIYMYM